MASYCRAGNLRILMNKSASASIRTLAALQKGDAAPIAGLAAAQGADELATIRRLVELGFVPGEIVRVIAKAFPGGHPIAVRLGNTTFALRRHEAALIHVADALPAAAP